MQRLLTIDEINRTYPNQWILIVDAEFDDADGPVRGEVLFHTNDRLEFLTQLRLVQGDYVTHHSGSPAKPLEMMLRPSSHPLYRGRGSDMIFMRRYRRGNRTWLTRVKL
jgi:hypothetical protein